MTARTVPMTHGPFFAFYRQCMKLFVFDRFLDEFAELISRYFRIEAAGLAHLPARGAAIIAPNHSGYAGADAIMLCHLVHRKSGRAPKILAHRAFFQLAHGAAAAMARRFGLCEARFEQARKTVEQGELLMLFPEAESGNFKPASERYQLQPFHGGFVRLALLTGAPIVPCLIVGAEESHLNLGTFDAGFLFRGLKLPIPFNLFPLPAKWKIRFLEAITLEGYTPADAENHELVHALAEKVRHRMQRALDHELRHRPYVFFPEQRSR